MRSYWATRIHEVRGKGGGSGEGSTLVTGHTLASQRSRFSPTVSASPLTCSRFHLPSHLSPPPPRRHLAPPSADRMTPLTCVCTCASSFFVKARKKKVGGRGAGGGVRRRKITLTKKKGKGAKVCKREKPLHSPLSFPRSSVCVFVSTRVLTQQLAGLWPRKS